MFLRTLVTLVLLVSASPVVAQPAAECPTSDCPPAVQASSLADVQAWRDAAAIHQHKVAFVDAVQRFVRAQAGTFGDEADELRGSLAAMRAELKQWDRAVNEFQSASSRSARVESQLALATVLLDRHRLEAALKALAAAERFDADRVDTHALRALAYGASSRWDEAARALRRAVAIQPRNPALSYPLAQHLFRLKRSDEGIQALRGVQRALDDARIVTRPALARARFERVDLLRQIANVAPIFPQARYVAGFEALEAGDYETALATLENAIAADPMLAGSSEARSRVNEAASALKRGEIAGALRQLQAALQASPEDGEVHRVIGLVYWIDDQSGKSIEHLRRAIQLTPADERARVLLSDVLVGDRRLAEAERELQQAVAAGLRSGQITHRLAQLYQRQALLPQATKAFQDTESYRPVVGQDRFFQSWGSLLVNQADFHGAVAAYTKRIEVNPNNAEAHRQLGEIYFLQGRDEEALAEFSVAIWLDPKDAKAHAAAGQVYARQQKLSDAADALQHALSLDGSLREARYARGTVLMRAGKTDEARAELDRFARQQAEAEAAGQREFQLDALRRQASRDLLVGDHERAIARFREAAAIDPGSARSHRDLGVALIRAKRFNEAIEPLAAAQRLQETTEGYIHLIDAFAGTGHTVEAERQRELYRWHVARLKLDRIRELGDR